VSSSRASSPVWYVLRAGVVGVLLGLVLFALYLGVAILRAG